VRVQKQDYKEKLECKMNKTTTSTTTAAAIGNNTGTASIGTYYQEWFQVDKRRRDISYYLSKVIGQLRGNYPFQRQSALNQLIHMLQLMIGDSNESKDKRLKNWSNDGNCCITVPNALVSILEQEIFNMIHKDICEETNVVLAICKFILKKSYHYEENKSAENDPILQAATNEQAKDNEENELSWINFGNGYPIKQILNTRESRIAEIKKGLTVLEGCFLLAPHCSQTLAAINGFKIILNVLSDTNAYINDTRYLYFKHANHMDRDNRACNYHSHGLFYSNATSFEQQIVEIQLMALDVLEAALHNCASNVILFCTDYGPDLIVTMFRSTTLAHSVRMKCLEFIMLLLHWTQLIDKQTGCKGDKEKDAETAAGSLMNRIKVFLGMKLAEDLIDLFQKLYNKKMENMLDTTIFDQFVKKLDQRHS
jgi:hypothetical protein